MKSVATLSSAVVFAVLSASLTAAPPAGPASRRAAPPRPAPHRPAIPTDVIAVRMIEEGKSLAADGKLDEAFAIVHRAYLRAQRNHDEPTWRAAMLEKMRIVVMMKHPPAERFFFNYIVGYYESKGESMLPTATEAAELAAEIQTRWYFDGTYSATEYGGLPFLTFWKYAITVYERGYGVSDPRTIAFREKVIRRLEKAALKCRRGYVKNEHNPHTRTTRKVHVAPSRYTSKAIQDAIAEIREVQRLSRKP